MRYSLLNFVACPRCHADLTCVTVAEAPCAVSPLGMAQCARVSAAGACVGPVPNWPQPTPLAEALTALSGHPAPPERNDEVVVETGVLTCGACGAWYPVIGCIPELLPDHLRDWARDRKWLESVSPGIPAALLNRWNDFRPALVQPDFGAHHKLAEIGLPSKITDDSFWGPGYASPFNVWNPEHTWHLIRNFAVAEPLLELARAQAVLDVGSGYSWTTEWLHKSGYEPIGVDICRAYLEIALVRIGANRPHLLVGDTEHLPIRSGSVRAVLGFEAFHHIPDRPAAMREFSRILVNGCPVVLVEPGRAHEHDAASVEVMRKYGTLEKGMDFRGVQAYAAGSGLFECRQHRMVRTVARSGAPLNVWKGATNLIGNHVYTLRKGDTPASTRIIRLRSRLVRRLRQAAPAWLRRTRARLNR